jgi:hypothetical protein
MPPRKLTPVQVLERLLIRLEKRMGAPSARQAGRLSDGYQRIGSGARLLAQGEAVFGEVSRLVRHQSVRGVTWHLGKL